MNSPYFDYRYTIVNDRAYTQENVLVYNIFLNNVSRKLNLTQIERYFQGYGRVLNCSTHTENCNYLLAIEPPRPNFYLIHFADSRSAARVLQKKHHVIYNYPVNVCAADSCSQPYGEYARELRAAELKTTKSQPKESSCSNVFAGESKAAILMLNDDCLEFIYEKLAIRDQIIFSQTCRRFSDVFIMLAKLKYKTLQLETLEKWQLWYTFQFLEKVGHVVESVKGIFPWDDRDRVIEFIGRYCTNTKSLNIHSISLGLERLSNLIGKMDSCIELELQGATLRDSSIQIIKCLPNLKILRLNENRNLSGNDICDFRNVEELSLEGCVSLQGHHFKQICQNLTNLHTLDVSNCKMLKGPEFRVMVHHLHKLEDLRMSSIRGHYEFIAQLPKLKRLKICEINLPHPLCQQLLIELVKRDSEQLEELILMGRTHLSIKTVSLVGDLKKLKKFRCTNSIMDDKYLKKLAQLTNLEHINLGKCLNVTEWGLLNLLQKCPKLNYINVTRCRLITEKFVYDAVNLLKEQQKQTQRKVPVLLTAYGTKIKISDLEPISSFLKILMD